MHRYMAANSEALIDKLSLTAVIHQDTVKCTWEAQGAVGGPLSMYTAAEESSSNLRVALLSRLLWKGPKG